MSPKRDGIIAILWGGQYLLLYSYQMKIVRFKDLVISLRLLRTTKGLYNFKANETMRRDFLL